MTRRTRRQIKVPCRVVAVPSAAWVCGKTIRVTRTEEIGVSRLRATGSTGRSHTQEPQEKEEKKVSEPAAGAETVQHVKINKSDMEMRIGKRTSITMHTRWPERISSLRKKVEKD
ncbi:unnamed protein product [Caenorhabditis auriculariae]|uniref:Uncharacterized protein n=1 Tax=Caenorhabditis auriculariae TaxID=2777116 RepID=A0A8S1GSD8_9PELO|nr:unnamed protein product [Caenorhabditis auriculariae]